MAESEETASVEVVDQHQPRDLVRELEALNAVMFNKPYILRLVRGIVQHNRSWEAEKKRQEMAPSDLPSLDVLFNFLRNLRWELKVMTTEPLTLTWQVQLAGTDAGIAGSCYVLGVYVGTTGVFRLVTSPSKNALTAELEMYYLRRSLRDLIILPGLQGIFQHWKGITTGLLVAPQMPPLAEVRSYTLPETDAVPYAAPEQAGG